MGERVKRSRVRVMPVWLSVPVWSLGGFLLLSKPLGIPLDWPEYFTVVGVAIFGAFVSARYYRMTIVETTGDSVTLTLAVRQRVKVASSEASDPTGPAYAVD